MFLVWQKVKVLFGKEKKKNQSKYKGVGGVGPDLEQGSLFPLGLGEALLWHQLLRAAVQIQPSALPESQHVPHPAVIANGLWYGI